MRVCKYVCAQLFQAYDWNMYCYCQINKNSTITQFSARHLPHAFAIPLLQLNCSGYTFFNFFSRQIIDPKQLKSYNFAYGKKPCPIYFAKVSAKYISISINVVKSW